jgi:hypothetical protein
MPSYFSKFPKITYKFPDGTEHTLADINIKYAMSDLVKSKSEVFYPFAFRDGDRPDILSDKYYDSPDYYWLVLMSNDVFDVNYDLPVSSEVFNKVLVNKYTEDAVAAGYTDNFDDVMGYCFETIHHYEDSDGHIIDFDSFQTLGNTKSVTIFDYEFNLNEEKRAIRFIEASRTSQVQTELEDKLRKLRADLGQ